MRPPALVAEVAERFGRVDVLVNNAGMVQTGVEDAPAHSSIRRPAEWDLDIALNLTTTVNVTRAACRRWWRPGTAGS